MPRSRLLDIYNMCFVVASPLVFGSGLCFFVHAKQTAVCVYSSGNGNCKFSLCLFSVYLTLKVCLPCFKFTFKFTEESLMLRHL